MNSIYNDKFIKMKHFLDLDLLGKKLSGNFIISNKNI